MVLTYWSQLVDSNEHTICAKWVRQKWVNSIQSHDILLSDDIFWPVQTISVRKYSFARLLSMRKYIRKRENRQPNQFDKMNLEIQKILRFKIRYRFCFHPCIEFEHGHHAIQLIKVPLRQIVLSRYMTMEDDSMTTNIVSHWASTMEYPTFWIVTIIFSELRGKQTTTVHNHQWSNDSTFLNLTRFKIQ